MQSRVWMISDNEFAETPSMTPFPQSQQLWFNVKVNANQPSPG